MSPDQMPVLIVLGVAALLLVNPVYLPDAGAPDYHHTVTPRLESQLPPTAERLNFSELSEAGRDVFLAARDPGSGEYVLDATETPPPDFTYSDETTEYAIRYEGEWYEFETVRPAASRIAGGVATLFTAMGVVFGALGLAMGWVSLRDPAK